MELYFYAVISEIDMHLEGLRKGLTGLRGLTEAMDNSLTQLEEEVKSSEVFMLKGLY